MDADVLSSGAVTRLAPLVDAFLERRDGRAVLRRIQREDLEQLRLHRNRAEVRRYLTDDRELTPELQEAWFLAGAHERLRIVEIRSQGGVVSVGLARLGPGAEVGCDAFELGSGFGAVALEMACRAVVREGRPYLTTFLENDRGVRLYDQAGFVWDTGATLRFYLRDFGDGLRPRAHGRMVLP